MRAWRAVCAAAGAAALAGLASVAPVAAADQPVLTASTLHAQEGDTVTVTVTGCAGTPTVLLDGDLLGPGGATSLTPTEATPGTWQLTWPVSGSDLGFTAVCASGARSAQVIVDVDTPVLVSDPWLGPQPPDRQLAAAVGTDCPQPTATVQFRVGDWIQVRTVPTDERGDFRAPAPDIGLGKQMYVRAWCDGANYIPFTWWTGQGKEPKVQTRVLELDAGGGAPGSTVTGRYPCHQEPVATAHDDQGDVPVDITWIAQPPRYRISATSRDSDLTLTVRCARDEETVRYDVEAPTLTVTGPTPDARAVVGSAGTVWATATDCPPGTTAKVQATGATGTTLTGWAAIDLWGDWSAEVAEGLPPGPATVTATCGSVTYRSVAFVVVSGPDGSTTTTTASAGDGTAAPAQPVPGSAGYTG